MRIPRRSMVCLALCLMLGAGGASAAGGAGAAGAADAVETYAGLCDASAGFSLGPDHFVVVGDERNVLTVYQPGQARAVKTFTLGNFLGTDDDGESDLEGAAVVGQRAYVISSHGRNAKGKVQGRRHRFFAVELDPGRLSLKPVGRPYQDLLKDLVAAPALASLPLKAAAERAPESPGGLNIEGLAAADGGLLIGFRNPLVDGKAILVPLENPDGLIDAKPAKFGSPVLLDLGGRGIRSIERVAHGYVIAAGPVADDGTFALYRWSGAASDRPVAFGQSAIATLKPEAIFTMPGTQRLRILSDDGGVLRDGVECKRLPAARQGFRSVTVAP
ncbi:DUF3616 domain-containing protein [Cupriavidus campinensis]|uniref:DUF3616 domain-containing protein n=1 Tax=Cupriavidus campinensis TaxID=151783 RepID=A0AAE9I739_9BURK|nr:DUF3616 domain-containing protein [Cupriavidus campinensis]URF08018.1 DUF3616 domain-containing protein [Cupriavidus campinensis]